MTQIMKLLQLAPDLQEQLLFLAPLKGLNERNLRALVQQLDWSKQRPIFEKMIVTRTETGQYSLFSQTERKPRSSVVELAGAVFLPPEAPLAGQRSALRHRHHPGWLPRAYACSPWTR
jgi:hypothetical protein